MGFIKKKGVNIFVVILKFRCKCFSKDFCVNNTFINLFSLVCKFVINTKGKKILKKTKKQKLPTY